MMRKSGELSFKEFQEAVNAAALLKSEFYSQLIKEIKEATAREKPKLDKEGNPVYDNNGNPILVENTTDEMIAAIFSIGMRGSKINDVGDAYIRRIENGAYYSRILEKSKDTANIARHMKERTRMDIAIVVKNILPDMTRVQTSVIPTKSGMDDYVDTGALPASAFLTQKELNLLKEGKGD